MRTLKDSSLGYAQLVIFKFTFFDNEGNVIWEKENGKQAKEAKAKFVELLDAGYKAYSVDAKGKKNKRIYEFDIDAEEIIMIPKTSRG